MVSRSAVAAAVRAAFLVAVSVSPSTAAAARALAPIAAISVAVSCMSVTAVAFMGGVSSLSGVGVKKAPSHPGG